MNISKNQIDVKNIVIKLENPNEKLGLNSLFS